MLREKFGLALHQLGRLDFERFGNMRMQLLARAAQKATVSRIPHQRMLEAIDRVRRPAALEDQLGRDEAGESGLQLVPVQTRDSAQQFVGELPSDRRADLSYTPHRRQPI